ncbi:MAG: 16S rRNA (guanine(527)-N(7))-methyltransferase RsmG [Ruminococcus sp.]|nr:16S rRNA (guanine(527)-N(7))-methyltransferase RsmG [Ruminococcus sp.]
MLPDFELCCSKFSEYKLELSIENYEKLDIYAQFLVEYNSHTNLTAITEPEQILTKHFIDSILLSKYVNIPENSAIIDVGTGAGFPSVPLKIMRPDIKLTLLDSLNKRIVFLEKLCGKLGIEAYLIHGRAEEVAQKPEYREKFYFSCARAVAELGTLCEYCLPFVKVGGSFISMKGPTEDVSKAQNAAKILGGALHEEIKYDLESEQRRIILIEKISQTPTKYPRNSGQIKKKPL